MVEEEIDICKVILMQKGSIGGEGCIFVLPYVGGVSARETTRYVTYVFVFFVFQNPRASSMPVGCYFIMVCFQFSCSFPGVLSVTQFGGCLVWPAVQYVSTHTKSTHTQYIHRTVESSAGRFWHSGAVLGRISRSPL